jgi:hypothetical protein
MRKFNGDRVRKLVNVACSLLFNSQMESSSSRSIMGTVGKEVRCSRGETKKAQLNDSNLFTPEKVDEAPTSPLAWLPAQPPPPSLMAGDHSVLWNRTRP